MKKQAHWLERFLPIPSDNNESDAGSTRGYTNYSRGFSILLMVLVLVPLTGISVLSHFQYKQLLQEEEKGQLVLNLEQAQSTIEAFVSEL